MKISQFISESEHIPAIDRIKRNSTVRLYYVRVKFYYNKVRIYCAPSLLSVTPSAKLLYV